ncbi:hypothetical protein EBU99_05415 [bacterium]|nr:hypothetical protein [bacterium]
MLARPSSGESRPPLTDVVVIQKKTALERYANEFKSDSARTYFLRDGQNDETLQKAHNQHCQTLDSLLAMLTEQSLSYSLHTLDDLNGDGNAGLFPYQFGTHPGLQSRLNLVLTVGGDGTLLRTSHFVGGETRMLGINSVPQHSVGHLCALKPETLERGLQDILSSQRAAKHVRRLVARTSKGDALPYALNDIYFGHQHPASASRYTLSIEGPRALSERQLSSGLWISTAAGSTAAIRSYGLGALDVTSNQYLVAVREPYVHPDHHLTLTKLALDGDHESVTLFSRMRHGIVCIDGPVTACVLGFGDTLEVGLAPEGMLMIYV